MALGHKKARAACRMYYLDAMTIRQIAADLKCSREAVREAVDDPTAQEEYLKAVERIRRRTRLRAAAAAEAALDRQIEFVTSVDVPAALRAAQLQTAERMLRRGLDRGEDEKRDVVIRIEGLEPAMPPDAIAQARETPENTGVETHFSDQDQ